MIPGIYTLPGVGSKPTCREGKSLNISNSSKNFPRMKGESGRTPIHVTSKGPGQEWNQPGYDPMALPSYCIYIYIYIYIYEIVEKNREIEPQRRSVSPQGIVGGWRVPQGGPAGNLSPRSMSYYNPITNPIPNQNQNPYVLREMNKAMLHDFRNSPMRKSPTRPLQEAARSIL